MSEGIYNNRLSKLIAAQKPTRSRYDDVAKAKTGKLCDCPNSQPGKINLDIFAHEPGCWIRERLESGKYTVNTSVIPHKIIDGNSLEVAIGGEDS
jgi:hypothetical protein